MQWNPTTFARATPDPMAWVAVAWIEAKGRRASPRAPGVLPIFTVSVHEDYLTTSEARRMLLLKRVAVAMRHRVLAGRPSLWVFPGGFFGFDAAARDWLGLDRRALRRIEERLPAVLTAFPAGATVAIGVDLGEGYSEDQYAWIVGLDASGALERIVIRRSVTDLARRPVTLSQWDASMSLNLRNTSLY